MVRVFRDMIKPMVITKTTDNPKDFNKPRQHQEQMAALFPSLVLTSHLHLWQPGDPIVATGTRWLLGIWTAKLYDLELLDLLNASLEDGLMQNTRIDVFNSQYLTDWEQLQAYIPGLRDLYVTPYVGLWESGELKQIGSGHPGKMLLLDRYRLQKAK